MEKTRIFLGLLEIAGYYTNLKTAFQSRGLECTFIDISDHSFKYGGSDIPNILVLWKIWANKRAFSNENLLLKGFYVFISQMLSFPLFLWALYSFDVFIFSYGRSFLIKNLDLPILKLFNKKIIFVFFGSDSRPPYIEKFIKSEDKYSILQCIKNTARQKNKLHQIEKYANFSINHPPTSHFHEKKIIQWLAVGIPKKYPLSNNVGSIREDSKIKILHAPSDPVVKGTEKIRKSIQSLQEKGYPIEYIEIVGKPHSTVINELNKCDFVIDQLYSDTPMAVFATEAAWHGKPSVVGGYYANYIHSDVLEDMIPPSLYCHPDNIQDSIEKMIVDESFRNNLGKKAREFVQKIWSPDMVAERYLRLIKGDIPGEWYYDPNNIRYLQGAGLPEQCAKNNIKAIIEYNGIKSLQLSDKPELEKSFKDFAYR